jgi:hypothetical protein
MDIKTRFRREEMKTMNEQNHSPSQQTSVDRREIGTIKKISNVGANPTLDTHSQTPRKLSCMKSAENSNSDSLRGLKTMNEQMEIRK